MPVKLDEGDKNGATGSAANIKLIAQALDVPEAALLGDGASSAELNDTCEMLRVWEALKESGDRRKVLAFARALLAR